MHKDNIPEAIKIHATKGKKLSFHCVIKGILIYHIIEGVVE